MAAKPTPGGSDGTYGTELNEFLDVGHNSDGTLLGTGGITHPVQGANTLVFTKYFTGNTDSDSETLVAHGVSSATDNILSVTASVFDDNNNTFRSPASGILDLRYDGTNVRLTSVHANLQGNAYRIKVDYKA